ncbi:hypothetical protein OSB04_029649 [Centaurea solstitialis]|uniref:Uncharacterized protein n=1 Tax=Centaurea solstitialis TaxID=347529 RepID=A0AA38W6D6_9ASTR|nr:hypothetical protein OSB04_029649 [Centaurea solstitialis]
MTSITNDTVPVVVETSITVDSPTNHSSITVDAPPPTNHVYGPSMLSLIFGAVQRSMQSYYPTFAEEGGLESALNFTVGGLLALVAIKGQGNPAFPFQTNPRTMNLSVNCLTTFAVASAAENVLSAPTSVSAIVARLGRMVSLLILVGSLTSLFYL